MRHGDEQDGRRDLSAETKEFKGPKHAEGLLGEGVATPAGVYVMDRVRVQHTDGHSPHSRDDDGNDPNETHVECDDG